MEKVTTYIQIGNVIFPNRQAADQDLAKHIEDAIFTTYASMCRSLSGALTK
jgi:uncharacterized protein (DUF1697 family)